MYNNQYRGFGGFKLQSFMRGDEEDLIRDSDECKSNMPEHELEKMYPEIYFVIYPQVIIICDEFDKACCCARIPSSHELEKMINDICDNMEHKAKANMMNNMRESGNIYAERVERDALRDLVGILIVRELFDRRHRPHHHFHHHRTE